MVVEIWRDSFALEVRAMSAPHFLFLLQAVWDAVWIFGPVFLLTWTAWRVAR